MGDGDDHQGETQLRAVADSTDAMVRDLGEACSRSASELGKRPRQEVLDLRPGEPGFGAVGFPAVVDDTELEEPARSEQLHALQGFAGRCLIQLHKRVSRGGP